MEIYKDLFMLNFYLCGVNDNDLLLCKGLTNRRFIRNRKNMYAIDLPVEPKALDIIKNIRERLFIISLWLKELIIVHLNIFRIIT